MIERDVILVDMDDVIADFYTGATSTIPADKRNLRTKFYAEHNYSPELHTEIEATYLAPGFHRSLTLLPGVHHGWQRLIDNGFRPRIATAPNKKNPTCVEDKLEWLNETMVPEFGSTVTEEAIIDKFKWRYPALALIDDRPIVPRGPNNTDVAEWTHILYGWEQLSVVPLADTAFRLLNWYAIDDLILTLEMLHATKY
jgi:5'-nucleotidase